MEPASEEQPEDFSRLAVIVPTHNGCDLVMDCLASLSRQGRFQVIVVDDASEDGTSRAVHSGYPIAEVVRLGERSGFTAAVNRGIEASDKDILLLLNSDTLVPDGALDAMLHAFASDARLGIGGAELFYPDSSRQWSGGREPTLGWLLALATGFASGLSGLPFYRWLRPVSGAGSGEVEWVTGAALALRRQVREEIGPFDDGFAFYCQDLDYCQRARRAGWRVAVLPGFRVEHRHGATIGLAEGSTPRFNPRLLWLDLVRWARKTGGARRARRVAWVLRLGTCLRLLVRWSTTPLVPGSKREMWDRDSAAFRDALAALRSNG